MLRELTRVSGTGTINDYFPTNNFDLTTEQLANVPSIDFFWEGQASEYRFALYRSTGEVIIEPTTVRGNTFTMFNPEELTHGRYVWQVFEVTRFSESDPSIANILNVYEGEVNVRQLPIYDPGDLYGNR